MSTPTLVELIKRRNKSYTAVEQGSIKTGKPYGGNTRLWNKFKKDDAVLYDRLRKTGWVFYEGEVYFAGMDQMIWKIYVTSAEEIDREEKIRERQETVSR